MIIETQSPAPNTNCEPCAASAHGPVLAAEADKPVRIDLPVAFRRNAMGAFEVPSDREALSPGEALSLLDKAVEAGVPVVWAKVSGPGDPLATPGPVLETLRAVRAAHPDMTLSLVTNGLHVADHADEFAALGLSFVTLLVDAVSPDVAVKTHAWVRPGTKTLRRDKAAAELVEAQNEAVRALAERAIPVMIRTTVYAGVNHDHVAQIAETMAELGATAMNLAPYSASYDAESPLPLLTPAQFDEAKAAAAASLSPAPDSGRCGGEAMDMENHPQGRTLLESFRGGTPLPVPAGDRPYTAVASSNGIDVDVHLGHATSFLIYGKDDADGLVQLLGRRDAPEPGGGDVRWNKLADVLSDCSLVLAAGAGERPKEVLAARGLRVAVTDGQVEPTVDTLYGGGRKGCGKSGRGKNKGC